MSKVVNNEIRANSLDDNKTQAKAAEVGDVWEEPFTHRRFKIYDLINYDKCSLVYYYHLNMYDTLIRDACELNFFMQRGYKYLGKSKASLSDLFKTENE